MDWSDRFSWLAALRGRRTTRSGAADPADMGTAFGLDASFDATADTARSTADAQPSAPPSPFESRLIRRSGL